MDAIDSIICIISVGNLIKFKFYFIVHFSHIDFVRLVTPLCGTNIDGSMNLLRFNLFYYLTKYF